MSFDFFSNILFFSIFFTTLIMFFPKFFNTRFFFLNKKMFSTFGNFFSGETLKFSFMNFFVFLIFIYIFLNNFLGLMPYFFVFTSLSFTTLIFSFFIWLNLFFLSLSFSFWDFFVHLVPQNCPFLLSFFLVIVELISNFIRAITLGVRLMANLTTGHLLLGLMSSMSSNTLSFFFQFIFFFLEILVAFIQSYVFALLTFLYIQEI